MKAQEPRVGHLSLIVRFLTALQLNPITCTLCWWLTEITCQPKSVKWIHWDRGWKGRYKEVVLGDSSTWGPVPRLWIYYLDSKSLIMEIIRGSIWLWSKVAVLFLELYPVVFNCWIKEMEYALERGDGCYQYYYIYYIYYIL